MKLQHPPMRLIDVLVDRMSPEEREAAQTQAVERYLYRLKHNQWRDPVSGAIKARSKRRAGRATHYRERIHDDE